MKTANLLLTVLTAISALAQGQINFGNRNIPTASGSGGGNGNGTYNVPIWEAGDPGNGAGDLPGGVTVGLFTQDRQLIGSAALRTDANSQFFATFQTFTVPNAQPGTSATLVVRVWQGTGGYEAARISGYLLSGETTFTTKPLGGTNSIGAVFATPGMTGWGLEDGSGWAPCFDCVFPPAVFTNITVTLKPGFNLVANPLTALDNSIESLFKNMQGGVPPGTKVFKFVNTANSYVTATWDDLDNRFIPAAVAGEITLPGDGVFVFLTGFEDKILNFAGVIQPTPSCQTFPQGWSIKSALAPGTSILPTGITSAGWRIFRFNRTTKAYDVFTFDGLDNAWIPGPLPSIPAGEAVFLYVPGSSKTWCPGDPPIGPFSNAQQNPSL